MAASLTPKIQDLVARLNRDPDSKIFLQLAEEYRRAGLLEEALLVCKGGLKKHPGYHSARVALGRIYLALNRLEEARAEFEAVLRASPDNLLANRMLGDVLALGGDAPGARERYQAVLTFGPADSELRSKLEALERGEDPRQVGRWGNDTTAPPAPRTAAATSGAAAAPRAVAPAPAPRVAPPAPPAARPAPEDSPPGRGFRRIVPGGEAAEAPPVRARQEPDAPPAPVQAFVSTPSAPRLVSLEAEEDAALEEARAQGGRGGAAAPQGAARDSMSTQTLAELYVRQGFIERAVGVYRRMLASDPANAQASRRLAELAALSAQGETETPAPVSSAPVPSEPAAGRSEAIARLERWLKTIQGGSR